MLGLFLEEIDEGLAVDLGSYHFTKKSILAFARKYDPQPFHLSEAGGRAGAPSGRYQPAAGIRRRAG
jgi:acyl dehydratase